MAHLLPIKSSTVFHAIAFTVAIALIASQPKSRPIQFTQSQPQQPTLVQVQIETEIPVAVRSTALRTH